jgi:adenosylcobinamide-GDP ribazoletransferase
MRRSGGTPGIGGAGRLSGAESGQPSPPGHRSRLAALALGPVFALQFLTIAPPLVRRPARHAELGNAEAFFPLVGLLIGLALVSLDAALGARVAPGVRDVLIVASLAIMTGALHLDGVVDTFDGLFGGHDAATRLQVMRDPRAGTYGVVAVVSLLVLKVAALGALPAPLRGPALLLAPCLGRWAIVETTWAFPYARPRGLGRAFKDGIGRRHVVLAGLSAGLAAVWLAGLAGAVLFGAATLLAWAAGIAVARRLGGLTGDTYGALCELVETAVLVAFGVPHLAATP